tara:strand:- start:89 stop:406 length:318 start_codon:yes stop_codon:yes gene_type:complete
MKKINNLFYILLIFFIAFVGCQSVKDGLTGNKKQNSDEFLIEKKNPLTKPPDYEKLPSPETATQEENQDDNFDLKKVLGQAKNKTSTQNQNNSLGKSILDKIKEN